MKTKTFPRFFGDKGVEIEQKITKCGYHKKIKVTAVSDAAGHQVIAICEKEKIHLLSRPLATHEEAVQLGNKVVAEGTEVYKKWFNLNNTAENLFAIFGGFYRG